MENAFRNSTIWLFERIARKTDRQTYRDIHARCGYGNNRLEEKGVDFWNYGSFGVTPRGHVKFLVRMYESRLPFNQRNIDIVKTMMRSRKVAGYTLY